MPRDTRQPRMLNETPAQLVAHLSHPNGWWRDTAQQLLVLKQDKSVAPALRKMAHVDRRISSRGFTRSGRSKGSARWMRALVRGLMKDADPQIRIQAIRASETLYKGGDRSFAADYRALAGDRENDVVIQALLTLNHLKVADTPALVTKTMAANKAKGVQIVGDGHSRSDGQSVRRPRRRGERRRRTCAVHDRRAGDHGARPDDLLRDVLRLPRRRRSWRARCRARAPASTRAPSLVGSPRVLGHRDYVTHGLLAGITGPVDGQRYDETMIPMGANPDEWIAAVGSYVRNSWGNRAPFVSAADVARVRAASSGRNDELDGRRD